jgi:hypothetical protein
MSKPFYCDICNKYYKTYQSLWKHNKTQHKSDISQSGRSLSQDKPIDFVRTYQCNFCNKEYKHPQSRWKHEKVCKNQHNKNIPDEFIKQQEQMAKDIEELKNLVKDMINKNYKMHHKTFEKMVNNGTIITDSNINNGTINNINIIAFGDEKLENVLTNTEKLDILKQKNALNYIIQYIHFNEKFPQFNNIIVTNNRANEAYIFDKETNKFKLVQKNTIIENLIEYRTCDIEDFFYELQDHLDPETRKIILKLAEHRGDDDSTREQVKLLLFNNKDKVKHLLK